MNERESKTDLGVIKIRREVLSAIAYIAAMEVKGVAKMGGGKLDEIYDLFGKKKSGRGVKIEINENEIKIDVSIFVEYGYNITEIASKVQENIRKSIENMIGLTSLEINVNVQGIESPTKP